MAPSDTPDFDTEAAHVHFSASCFNTAWDFIDKQTRTPAEDEEMLLQAMVSYWHWTQREDFDDSKASVGSWQISRVFALLGQAENARRFAQRSLDQAVKGEAGPFFEAYAHEALARAAWIQGDAARADHHKKKARAIVQAIDDEDSRDLILGDLDTISF